MRFVAPQTRITRENFCVADYHSIILQLSGRFLQPIASIMRQVDVAAQVEAIPESLVYYKHRILEILLDSHQSNWESNRVRSYVRIAMWYSTTLPTKAAVC
jgi:hypothetical protein